MTKDKKQPQWGYRKEGSKVISKLFPEGRPARGWHDNPGKAEAKGKPRDDSA